MPDSFEQLVESGTFDLVAQTAEYELLQRLSGRRRATVECSVNIRWYIFDLDRRHDNIQSDWRRHFGASSSKTTP